MLIMCKFKTTLMIVATAAVGAAGSTIGTSCLLAGVVLRPPLPPRPPRPVQAREEGQEGQGREAHQGRDRVDGQPRRRLQRAPRRHLSKCVCRRRESPKESLDMCARVHFLTEREKRASERASDGETRQSARRSVPSLIEAAALLLKALHW